MRLKSWGVQIALTLACLGVLGCQLTNSFSLAQAPTATATRTRPRPTFTPLPPPTDTPVPANTAPPPTAKPTVRPTAVPTRRPPTATPAPPPPASSAPPKPQFKYKAVNQGCEHSGQTFIQGTVYDRGGGTVNGVMVVMSGGGPDGAWADKRESGTDGDGFYSMIVEANGPARGQKRWVWVVEGTNRVSDVAEFQFNDLKEDKPGTCWRGFVDFQQQY